jgi:thioredoxin:protein disulfide reductase
MHSLRSPLFLVFAVCGFLLYNSTSHASTPPQEHTPTTVIASAVNDHATSSSFSTRIADTFTNTSSLALRMLLALLLGLLLSLTPCIYPMIPITVGILQAGSSRSIGRNFARASAYACGMAITFACLGLISAYTGNLFGSAMNSPWVIGAMILLLVYVAGSMIGLYDMYIPRMLQQNHTPAGGGSLLSAFSFGAASGTVASPCLSPGLLLLISIIAKEGNMLTGFCMLFSFGIGLSIPLLLIGTFSSSLNRLPRAGFWMVEIKRLLGFMMLFVCLYFLKPFVPWHILLWMACILLFAMQAFYMFINIGTSRQTRGMRNSTLGAISVLCAFCLVTAYKATVNKSECSSDSFWLHEFDDAKTEALAQQKKILLDVSAPYCTICTAIDKKFFCNEFVQEICLAHAVPVQINGADDTHQTHMNLQRSLHIIGAPTLVLLDPITGTELKRWGAELYDKTTQEFVRELEALLA